MTNGIAVADLARVNARLEGASALDVLRWTFDTFDDDVVVACSFEDVVLAHLVHCLRPEIPVTFLDTGGHFAETLEFVARVERDWGLRVERLTPPPAADAWPCGTAECCQWRKVVPLAAALAGRAAWVSAIKRVDAPTRAATPVVGWDEKFQLVKVSPLAAWNDDDVAAYLAMHELPIHPLWSEGYTSIGCAATSQRPLEGEGRRSGRWTGTGKLECGLHEG